MNSHFLVVFKKEIMDMFRDKKTLILGLLLPLIMFPIIYGFIGYSIKNSNESANKDVKVAVVGNSNNIIKIIKLDKNITIKDIKDTDKALEKGSIDAVITIPKNFDKEVQKGNISNINIKIDEASSKSSMVGEKLANMVDSYSKQIVGVRLKLRGIDPKILQPINIVRDKLKKKNGDSGEAGMFLGMMVPMFLLIYAGVSPMAVAIDNGAGEKERGTLEPLLSTCANRTSLLWGKCCAIMTMGFLGILSTLVGLGIGFKLMQSMLGDVKDSSSGMGNISKLSLDPKAVVLILLLGIGLVLIFSSLELAVSVYARSFKEAQTYLSPISIITLVPAYATMMMDAKSIGFQWFSIPLANASCLMKEAFAGIFNVTHIAIVFGWMFVYVLIAIGFTRYMFSREEVIFRS